MVVSADVTLGLLLAIGMDRDCDKLYVFGVMVLHIYLHSFCVARRVGVSLLEVLVIGLLGVSCSASRVDLRWGSEDHRRRNLSASFYVRCTNAGKCVLLI